MQDCRAAFALELPAAVGSVRQAPLTLSGTPFKPLGWKSDAGHRSFAQLQAAGMGVADFPQRSAITSHMDWLPTFAARTDVDLSADRKRDGVDLTQVLTGEATTEPREVFHYFRGFDLQAIRSGFAPR
jgi:hypothetical protein